MPGQRAYQTWRTWSHTYVSSGVMNLNLAPNFVYILPVDLLTFLSRNGVTSYRVSTEHGRGHPAYFLNPTFAPGVLCANVEFKNMRDVICRMSSPVLSLAPYVPTGMCKPNLNFLWPSRAYSDVTKVGVTRGGNWGWRPLFSLKNWRPFWLITVTFIYFTRISPPWRVSLCTYLPIRPRLSTILCIFAHKFFFVRVSPPGGFHPGRSVLPCDATALQLPATFDQTNAANCNVYFHV